MTINWKSPFKIPLVGFNLKILNEERQHYDNGYLNLFSLLVTVFLDAIESWFIPNIFDSNGLIYSLSNYSCWE